MKTRQHRLNSVEEIKPRLNDLVGKEVNIILRNNTVIFGSVVKTGIEKMEIRNHRGKVSVVLVAEIIELYFDTKE